jgi:hypothetical protein
MSRYHLPSVRREQAERVPVRNGGKESKPMETIAERGEKGVRKWTSGQ